MNRLVALLFLGGLQWSARARDTLDAVCLHFGLALHNALQLRQGRQRVRHLYRAERLATLGQLAAGAAHEIRNPLTSIRSTIQYLRRDYDDDSDKGRLVDDLIGEVDRVDDIISGLLSFARPAEPVLRDVDLGVLLQQVARLVDNMARAQGVELDTDDSCDGPWITGDPDQLKQVFLNLCMNSLQAMPGGGRLALRVTRGDRNLAVEVCDTGGGMSSEALERAFDPFYTTREGGTGLGLPICYGIVLRHGGDIDVDSEVGAGTTVRVRLPLPAGQAPCGQAAS